MNWRSIARALLTVAPIVAVALLSARGGVWFQAALVTMCSYIAMDRTNLAPLGVLLQGLAMLAGFLSLYFAVLVPPLFVVGCAAFSAATIRLAAAGEKLRSLGNFTFIPSLYLACEVSEGLPHEQFAQTAMACVPIFALALIPVLLLAVVDSTGSERHSALLRKLEAGSGLEAATESMIAAALGVGLAAAIVEWGHLQHGQWVIWSASSVVTGSVDASRRKLHDRMTGAVIGVPIGIALSFLIPHNVYTYGSAVLLAMLTLVAFKSYVVAFTSRCGLVALVLMLSGGSPGIASERMINVVLGCLSGTALVLLVHAAARRRR